MLTVAQLFQDPSGGLINQRYVLGMVRLAEATNLSEAEREQLFRLSLLVGKKLAAVFMHRKRFSEIQTSLITAAQQPKLGGAGDPVHRIEYSETLFIEFDEFLVQVKSTLDYLVKIPVPILGKKTWNLRTFGDEGDAVRKALARNLPNALKARGDGISRLVLDKHVSWLKETIEARDRINHFVDDGVAFEHFAVIPITTDGVMRVQVPMWSTEQTVVDYMEVIWNNLFILVEDFTALFIHFRIKPGLAFFHGDRALTEVDCPWVVTTEEEMNRVLRQGDWRTA